jgi:hypothetical protein
VTTVLFDPGFGVTLPRALHQFGVEAVAHADQFPVGTPDAAWLAAAAERDWIVVTGDRRAERVPAARELLRASGVACFVLAVGRRGRLEQVALVAKAWPRMQRVAARTPRPFVAVLSAGRVPDDQETRRVVPGPTRPRRSRLQPRLPGLD